MSITFGLALVLVLVLFALMRAWPPARQGIVDLAYAMACVYLAFQLFLR